MYEIVQEHSTLQVQEKQLKKMIVNSVILFFTSFSNEQHLILETTSIYSPRR